MSRPWNGKESEIVQAYMNGERLDSIEQRFQISRASVYGILRASECELHGMPKELKYNHAAIVADYLAGMTLRGLVEKYHLPHYQVLYPIFAKSGIVADRIGGAQPLSMKPFNPEFFAKQDKETAYWCGFLMADGSIRQDKEGLNTWVLSLSLHVKDAEHHYAFCDAIGVDRSFVRWYESKYRDSVSRMQTITVYHPSLPDALRPWGIVPKKTHNFVAPQVDANLLPAYLRGWADGDGNVRLDGKSSIFQVTGNFDGLQWYESALRRIGYEGSIKVKQAPGKVWGRLSVHGANSVKTIAALLETNDFCLRRKWDKVLGGDL